MHAMGANVSGVIGSSVAAGFYFQSLEFLEKISVRSSDRNKFYLDVIIHVSFMVHHILSLF